MYIDERKDNHAKGIGAYANALSCEVVGEFISM